LSVQLGSASADIIIHADKAQAGVNTAVSALSQLDARAKSSGQSFDAIGAGAAKAGATTAQGMQTAQSAVQQLATHAQSTGQALGTLGNALGIAGGGIAAGLGAAVKTATDFEAQLSAVKAATGATAGEMAQLRTAALALGQDTTLAGVSASGAAQAMEALGKAGISVSDQIGGATKGALLLASAGAVEFGQAAEIAANAMTVFGLKGSDVTHIADLFASAAAASTIDVKDLAQSMQQTGLVAAQMGHTIEETTGVLTAFGAAGLKGSDAGTSLKQLMLSLVNPSQEAADAIKQYGLAFSDASGKQLSFAGIADQLKTKLAGLTDEQRNAALATIFGSDAIRGALVLYNQGSDGIQRYTDQINHAGAAAEAGATRNDNLKGSITQLKDSLETLGIGVGTALIPQLRGIAEAATGLANGFQNLSPGARSTALGIAEIAAGGLLATAALVKITQGAIAAAEAITTLNLAFTALTGTSLIGGLVALGPALAAVAVVAGLVAIGMKGTNDALSGTAKVIGGELGPSIAALKFSWQDMFFQGDANKIAQAVKDYSNGIGGAVPKVEDLRTTLAKVNVEVDKLSHQTFRGFDDNQRLTQLRNVAKGLNDEIAQRDKLNAQQNIRDNYLTSEAEAGQAYTTQLRAQEQAIRNVAIARAEERKAAALAAPPTQEGIQRLGQLDLNTFGTQQQQNVNNQAAALASARLSLEAYRQSLADFSATNATAMQSITAQTGPLSAALDLVNQKRAQGLPLSARENQLLTDIPGSLAGATAAYNDIVIAQGALAVQQQRAASFAGEQTTAFSGMGGSAGALAGQLQTLQAALFGLNSAFGALGNENAKLSAQFNVLAPRIQALQDKAKTPLGLNGNEQTELDTLLTTQQAIGDQIGTNAAKQRENVVAQQQTTTAAQETAQALEALNQADLVAKSQPFNNREDRRTAVGPDLPPPPVTPPPPVIVPAQLDPNAPAQIAGELANIPAPPPVKVPVELDTKALTGGAGVTASLFANAVQAQTVTIDVDDKATPVLSTVQQTLATVGATNANPTLTVTDNATATIDGVTGALSTLGASSATPVANLEDNASGPLGGVQGAVDGLDGRVIHISASVDTSAALAAIQDLRDHMPSSPSKKGAFRTLPQWKSVYADLAPAGEDAVVSIQSTTQAMSRALGVGIDEATDAAAKSAAELATTVAGAVTATVEALDRLATFKAPDPRRFQALHDALLPILSAFAGDAAGSSEESLKLTGQWADNANKLVSLVSSGADALGKLRDFKRPSDEAINAFRDVSQYLLAVMLQVASDTDAKLVEAGAKWAEGAGKIYASVGQGVDVLTKLQNFRRPTDRAVTDFRDVSQFLVNIMAQVAADAELGPVADAGKWADSAGKVFGAVGSGVDALVKLQTFVRPTDQAVKSFRDVSQYLVNVIAQVAADGEGPAFAGAATWADSAGKIFAAVAGGVDALTKLGTFQRPTDQAVNSFRDVAQYVVNVLAQVAADSDQGAVADAAKWADNAGRILAILKVGAEGFAALQDFRAPAEAALRAFADATATITRLIAQSSATLDADALKQAALYADTAGKVVGLLGTGVDALGKLATGDLAFPDAGRLAAFANGTREAVLALSAAAQTISGPALTAAGTYADGAGKVVSLIGNGVKGFSELATFTAPSAAQIQQFKSAVSATVIAIAQAATEISADAVKSAGQYSEGAGKAVGLLGSAVSAFGGLKDFVAPGKESIDALVSVTRYGVDQLIGISGSYNKGQLDQLSGFASATSSAYGALGAALNASKALGDDKRVKPADAVGQALSEFQAGLTPLSQLVAVSQQYATQGATIGANIAKAYADIAGTLPNLNGQQATVAASVSVSGTQQTVIVHRHEPQEVRLSFLADNATWIVKSLTVDGQARKATSDLIAGEIAATLEAGAAA